MIYVFVDFEMNMIDSEYKKEKKICKSEIIEIGAVKLDEDYNEIDSFKSYVKPAYGTMASRIIKLTGITDDMVENAPSYAFAMGSFIEWCADADVIYAWSENDLRQLRKEARLKEYTHPGLESIISRWKDFQKEYAKLIGTSRRISLSDAVFYLGENFQGQSMMPCGMPGIPLRCSSSQRMRRIFQDHGPGHRCVQAQEESDIFPVRGIWRYTSG